MLARHPRVNMREGGMGEAKVSIVAQASAQTVLQCRGQQPITCSGLFRAVVVVVSAHSAVGIEYATIWWPAYNICSLTEPPLRKDLFFKGCSAYNIF